MTNDPGNKEDAILQELRKANRLAKRKQTSHLLHLVLSVCTFGCGYRSDRDRLCSFSAQRAS